MSLTPTGPHNSTTYVTPIYATELRATETTERNWMSIAALIASFVLPIAGIILGHLARRAYRDGRATNGSLALAGMIIGYVLTFLSTVAIALAIMGMSWFSAGSTLT